MKNINEFITETKAKKYQHVDKLYNNFPEVNKLVKYVISELNKYSKTKRLYDNSDVTEHDKALKSFLWKFISEYDKSDKMGNKIYNFMNQIVHESGF